ncbi:MAG: hypothetical protein ACLFTK_07755 [Anaerolineales bacterium]
MILKKLLSCSHCLIVLSLIASLMPFGPAQAQRDAPPPIIQVQRADEVLRLQVPSGWRAEVLNNPDLPFARMDNLAASEAELPTQVQLIIRHMDDLNPLLDNPIDPFAESVPFSYLQQYARTQFAANEGVFAAPVITSDANQTSAAMLYVERMESPRFDAGLRYALSLAIAFDLPGNDLALMLFEGPSSGGEPLLAIWGDILQTLTFNGRSPAFAADPDSLFEEFLSPTALLDRLRQGPPTPFAADPMPEPLGAPGIAQNIQSEANQVQFVQFEDWVFERFDDGASAILTSPEGHATITLALTPWPDDEEITLADLLDARQMAEQWVFAEGPAAFQWGALPALAASVVTDDETIEVQIIMVRLSLTPALLTVLYQRQINDPPDAGLTLALQTWFNTLLTMRVNGMTISPGDLNAVIDLPQ